MRRVLLGVLLGIALSLGSGAALSFAGKDIYLISHDRAHAPGLDLQCNYQVDELTQFICWRERARYRGASSIYVQFTPKWVNVYRGPPRGRWDVLARYRG
jgi:hypothetical protein